MQLDFPLEADSHKVVQEMLFLFWNPKVHDYVLKSLQTYPLLSQLNPVSVFTSNFCNIYLNIIHVPSHLFLAIFPSEILYEGRFLLMHTVCSVYPNLLAVIIITIQCVQIMKLVYLIVSVSCGGGHVVA
jgi:hypothetical protein